MKAKALKHKTTAAEKISGIERSLRERGESDVKERARRIFGAWKKKYEARRRRGK